MSRIAVVLSLVLVAACGDNLTVSTHSTTRQDASVDAPGIDAFVPFVRVFGQVITYGQPAALVQVSTIEGPAQTTMTDLDGNFYFDVPDGSRLIMKVGPVNLPSNALPMIRGVIAHDDLRVRNFYIIDEEEVMGVEQALGVTFDPTKAIVEVDFRNAAIGGYSATLTSPSSGPLTPEFGIVADDQGQPQLGTTTIAGGDGSTLLLAGLPPTSAVSFAPTVPSAATLPCQPRDVDPLPLQAGVVTWFDYECGNGED